MSDSIAMGLILAILIGAQFSFFMSLAKLKQWTDEITTGVVGGVPTSLAHRWSTLWTTWLPLNFFVGAYAFLIGAGIALVARGIGDEDCVPSAELGYKRALS
jgi:hypothetical protein